VFASSNQAGTAILLVLSAIFLLIGVQGTSLIRFSAGSNTFEMDQRKRGIERQVAAVAKEDPDRAAGIIEGAEIAFPGLGSFDASEAVVYEERVADAISSQGYDVSNSERSSIFREFLVAEPDKALEGWIHVGAIYRKRAFLETQEAIEIAKYFDATNKVPAVIVTNADFFKATAENIAEEFAIRLVRWRGDSDNDALRQALAEFR
jgi:hypothetical protein